MPIDAISVDHFNAPLPVQEVALIESVPGESRDAFILRAGQALDTYTAETGFEGCSRIWVNPEGNRWGVGLISNEAHAGCTLLNHAPFENLIATDESIHSHPTGKRYRTNASDRIFLGQRGAQNQVRSVEGSRFSKEDYASGPGYMVHEGKLYHQSGPGTAQLLGPVWADEPPGVTPPSGKLGAKLRARRQLREAESAPRLDATQDTTVIHASVPARPALRQ